MVSRFFITIASAGALLSMTSFAYAVPVTVCGLYKHPEKFNGKMITITGLFRGYSEAEFLSADGCTLGIWITFPGSGAAKVPFELEKDEGYKKWSELVAPTPGTFDSYGKGIAATYYGRFIYHPEPNRWNPGLRRLIVKRITNVSLADPVQRDIP